MTVQLRTASSSATHQSAVSLPSPCNDLQGAAPEEQLIDDLKARREKLGWSIHDVVERSGLDELSLSEWERGATSPQLGSAQLWASALGLNFILVPFGNDTRSGLKVDWDNRRITVDGKPVRLTPMEWKALERLAWTPGELVTHQALFQHLYGVERDYRAESTAIRVLVTKLRRLLPLRISAHWGKGYILTGIEPSRGCAANTDDKAAPKPERAAIQCERVAVHPGPAPRSAPPTRREFAEFGRAEARRAADPAPNHNRCRAEELGVIERFLAERGATRCPDGATIQQSPLPTLIWDKIKRKWVRPATFGNEAR